MPVCPKCKSLSVGERCATCGTERERSPLPPVERNQLSVPRIDLNAMAGGAGAVEAEKRHRQASAYLSLQPSETAVLHAASRIFSAFVASGQVTEANQQELSDRAVKLATRMALVIEKYIQSDNEDW